MSNGISALLSGVMLVVISIVATLMVIPFLSTTTMNATSQIETQTEQKLGCVYADLYIVNATYDANLDCTKGRNHTLNVTVKNSGQVKLTLDKVFIKNTTGYVIGYDIDRNLSSGEKVTLTNITNDYADCLALVRQSNTSSTGYNTYINKIYLTSTNCPDATDQIDEDYITYVNCNMSESQATTYSKGLWRFNENSTSFNII